MHEHYSRRIDANSTTNNLAKTTFNSSKFSVSERFVEYHALASVEQSDMDAFSSKSLEQANYPVLQGYLAQIEYNPLSPLSQALENSRLRSEETRDNCVVLDYPGERN